MKTILLIIVALTLSILFISNVSANAICSEDQKTPCDDVIILKPGEKYEYVDVGFYQLLASIGIGGSVMLGLIVYYKKLRK